MGRRKKKSCISWYAVMMKMLRMPAVLRITEEDHPKQSCHGSCHPWSLSLSSTLNIHIIIDIRLNNCTVIYEHTYEHICEHLYEHTHKHSVYQQTYKIFLKIQSIILLRLNSTWFAVSKQTADHFRVDEFTFFSFRSSANRTSQQSIESTIQWKSIIHE